jgi:hypothetical protein
MRLYEVQLGDSPASIAATHAGCPKCSRDLVALHSHRASIVHPNGYRTFKEPLRAGEKIALPDKWFDGSLDKLSPAYFTALPHHDGVTPSKLGVSGVLGDQAQLDVAAAAVGTLAALGDQPFNDAVSGVAAAIDASVQEVRGTGSPAVYAVPYADEVRKATATARQRNATLAAAIAAGDQSAGAPIRNAILKDFSNALGSAGLALQTFYGDPGQVQVDIGQARIDPTPTSAAQAAATAMGADPNYCMSVAQPRSAVNSAVHAFKTAWNASNPSTPVPINTGTYEQVTADAIARVLGTSPAACGGARVAPGGSGGGSGNQILPPQPQSGLGVGAIVGLGLLGAGAVGGAIYLATSKPPARVRRVRRVSPQPFRRGFPS